ncbi:YidB family protein [Streptomyces sp. NPDC005708]|uniref:YidB family protein n=1 Tax=Streptomyces sp. NPDC005708 TaxID=3154564 RepID=UPI0033ED4D66
MADSAKSSGMADELQALLHGASKFLSDHELKNVVESWLGSGPNEPVSTRQIENAFGKDNVAAASKETGVGVDTLTAELPDAIDKASPSGKIEAPTSVGSELKDLLDNLFSRTSGTR